MPHFTRHTVTKLLKKVLLADHGLTPTGTGALQISDSAAFQGQSAAAITITQTNVMTAAQAAAIGGASSASGASGSGAAGGEYY